MKEVPNGVPIVEIGTGAGWPKVQGRCPACGHNSLFLASGGYVTCGIIACPNPTVVADSLEPPKRDRGLYEDLTIRDRSRSKAQSRLIGGMPG